jgi:hypothetical protein
MPYLAVISLNEIPATLPVRSFAAIQSMTDDRYPQALGRQLGTDVRTLGTISQQRGQRADARLPRRAYERDFATQAGLAAVPDQRDGRLTQTGRSLDLCPAWSGLLRG